MTTDLEARLRELPDRLAGLHADRDLAAAVRARHRHHRRLRVTTASVAVAALLVGTMVAVGSRRDQTLPPADPIPSATATASPRPTRTCCPGPPVGRWPATPASGRRCCATSTRSPGATCRHT
jgi:hypothetical protein